jgi:cobalamin synthase
MSRIISFYEFGERYKPLRIAGALFTLIGAVLLAISAVLLVAGLYAFLAVTTDEPLPGMGHIAVRQVPGLPFNVGLGGILALIWSIGLLVAGLQHSALGALCRLLIHLEENTRASAQSLDKIRTRLESSGEGVEPLFRT